ncbi:MAG TPA: lytic transglycosylase domain-containing protein [Rugosimonospora sp.]|nr:lytic transglycosylase domain-containing protein [Rugosimonospora sp.]
MRTHRQQQIPLAQRGHLVALGALVAALGGGATYGTHVARIAKEPSPVPAATDVRVPQADASPGHDHVTITESTAPRRSPAPHPSPSRSPAPSPSAVAPARPLSALATPHAVAAVPAGCAPYRGNQLIACILLPAYGFSLNQMGPLINLWNGESGWRATARNPSSGAYGIPQALPASKLATAGTDWRTNPATQIRWGLGYIRAAYGTPASAWAQWRARSPHWY